MKSLLTSTDPAAVELYNADSLGQTPILIICDHASNAVPKALDDMGISQADLNRHIGWDIGAQQISKHLADHLGAPALLAGVSRLVIDVNRAPSHEKSIPEISDHTAIPANTNLTPLQKQQRIDEIYTPYHDKFAECLTAIRAQGTEPLVISIHSFTAELKGDTRETEIGILWDNNKDFAHRMIETLREQNPDMMIGSNDPYSFLDDPELNHSLRRHDLHKGTRYMLVEFRQDLIEQDEAAEKYAAIFLKALKQIL